MSETTIIAATEAQAKFSELLDRVRGGETFSITLHGEETAKLVPVIKIVREDIHKAVANIKASRSLLNPVGQPKLTIKGLISEGRS